MKLDHLKDKIINFYDIEAEHERDALIQDIIVISKATPKEAFVEEVRTSFELKALSGIGVIYEALGHDPDNWGAFFFEEIQRAFTIAENSSEPFNVMDGLDEISMTDVTLVKERDEIIRFLFSQIDHDSEVIRYKAIWYLADWIDDDISYKYMEVISKIKKSLVDDENWRVRIVSKMFLEDLNKLPKDYKMSFSDKLKVKFLNEYKFD